MAAAGAMTAGQEKLKTGMLAGSKLEDYDVSVTLGTGSFGRVRFCTHKVCLTR